jgi:organic radical activating enzyme
MKPETTKKNEPDISDLYRLPWSKNDHPVGWVEITSFCNMDCKWCYRKKDSKRFDGHKTLEKINEEILIVKKIKNCDAILISGGEPLMHPRIIEIVKSVKDQGLRPFILTNGRLLDKELLIKLKNAGLIGIDMRLNSHLGDKNSLEDSLVNLREKYKNLFSLVEGLHLVLTFVIDKEDSSMVSEMVKWFHENHKTIGSLVFILKRQPILNKNEKIETKNLLFLPDLYPEVLKGSQGLRYSAYLGSQAEDFQIKWLWSFPIILNGKVIGYANKKFSELMQTRYHFKSGKYFFILNKKDYSVYFIKFLISCIFCKDKILIKNFLKEVLKNPLNLFKKIYWQQILIVNPPFFVEGKRDFCDPCTCSTLYNGKFYPTCYLGEYLYLGEKYYELKR